MQMLEIIRRLDSENAVRFLLSAYAESLQRRVSGNGLPGGVDRKSTRLNSSH